jgi:predicted nucleic acid-binding protein
VLVRLIVRDEPKQLAKAEALLDRDVWVSHVVLHETVWVLQRLYGFGVEQLSLALQMLMNHERVVLEDTLVVKAALDHFRSRPALGFSDGFVLEIARKAGHTPLATFEKQLGRLAGAQKL